MSEAAMGLLKAGIASRKTCSLINKIYSLRSILKLMSGVHCLILKQDLGLSHA